MSNNNQRVVRSEDAFQSLLNDGLAGALTKVFGVSPEMAAAVAKGAQEGLAAQVLGKQGVGKVVEKVIIPAVPENPNTGAGAAAMVVEKVRVGPDGNELRGPHF